MKLNMLETEVFAAQDGPRSTHGGIRVPSDHRCAIVRDGQGTRVSAHSWTGDPEGGVGIRCHGADDLRVNPTPSATGAHAGSAAGSHRRSPPRIPTPRKEHSCVETKSAANLG